MTKVFVPPLPTCLEELRARITEAVATTDVDVICRIWDAIAYRRDICRVTQGNHIKQLRVSGDNTSTYTAFCDTYIIILYVVYFPCYYTLVLYN